MAGEQGEKHGRAGSDSISILFYFKSHDLGRVVTLSDVCFERVTWGRVEN